MKPKLLVDLDGTLSHKAAYPKIGNARIRVIELLRMFQERGYPVWIYTCRDWWQENNIKEWCHKNKLIPDGIICGKPLGIVVDDYSVNSNLTGGEISVLEWAIDHLTGEMNKELNREVKE